MATKSQAVASVVPPKRASKSRRGRGASTKPRLTLPELESELGHSFARRALLEEALTHRSALNLEQADVAAAAVAMEPRRCNERLEFLGDSVLGLCISRRLMQQSSDFNEGQLSRMRAALVNEESLAVIARHLNLGAAVRVGKGERQSGGVERDALLADVLEAVIGAVFEDGGFAAADAVVGKVFEGALSDDVSLLAQTDYKTVLQELTQESYRLTPTYEVHAESGPDHRKNFEVMVMLEGRELGRGQGASKKRASQAAAKQALLSLKADGDAVPATPMKGRKS